MTMQDNQQVQLAKYPDGIPNEDDFELVSKPIPSLSAGDVLCQTLYLSLDPYMRSQIAGRHISGSINVGDVMRGETLSRVVESTDSRFQTGDIVRGMGGWQTFSVLPADQLQPVDKNIKPISYALSILGMPGLTAYAGLIWLAKPQDKNVVVIPAATGAVGATAGQLAKIHGCTVVGIAGSDEKCRYATEILGYDACINRKSEDVSAQLDRLCPSGIDVFFDLVGGEVLQIASERLAVGARVILCGLMAEYNEKTRAAGPAPGLWIKARATVYGLVVYDFEARRNEFVSNCLPYVESGRMQMREDISEGLASAPKAFSRLMNGDNLGKVLVRVASDSP